MSDRLGVSVLAALLIVVAFLGWRIVVLTGTDAGFDPPESTTTTTEPDAGDEFIASWRRAHDGEYLVAGYRIREGEAVEDESAEIVANLEGRRLVNIDGTIVYERAGVTQTCRQTLNELFCTPEEPLRSITVELQELVELTDQTGPYRVIAGEIAGCFDVALDPSQGAIDPRFGTSATFCFDAVTGAVTSSRVVGLNRSETWRAETLEPLVTPEGLSGRFPEPLIAELLDGS